MKNKFLNRFSKYNICYIIGITIIVGFYLSICYPDFFEIGDDMLIFNFTDIYLILIIPIFSIFYGSISYIKVRKIFLPQLIYYVIFMLGYLLPTILINGNFEKTGGISILSLYPTVFSLVGTLITALVCYIVKSAKDYKD